MNEQRRGAGGDRRMIGDGSGVVVVGGWTRGAHKTAVTKLDFRAS